MTFNKMLLALIVVLGGIGCDQATKEVARQHLQGQGRLSYLGDSFRLVYAENHGAFLGMGAELSGELRAALFIGMTTLLLVGLVVWLVRKPDLSNAALMAVALFVSGGVGNLIDRIAFDGAVTDFLNLGVGSIRTGIFNVADVWIVLGVALIVISPEFRAKPPPKASEEATP